MDRLRSQNSNFPPKLQLKGITIQENSQDLLTNPQNGGFRSARKNMEHKKEEPRVIKRTSTGIKKNFISSIFLSEASEEPNIPNNDAISISETEMSWKDADTKAFVQWYQEMTKKVEIATTGK
jgi:hypothetical protein